MSPRKKRIIMALKTELINVLFQNTHFIGWETEAQRKVICQLNQCGPRTRSVFPLAAGNLKIIEK